MAVRKLANKKWQYDFRARGKRYRKSGFRTRAQALAEEERAVERLMRNRVRITLAEAYLRYLGDKTKLKPLSRDHWARMWRRLKPVLGHLYLDEIGVFELDEFKRSLPADFKESTINHHLALVRAVLRHFWRRGLLDAVPYIPTESVARSSARWYTEAERDRLLSGMLELRPRWYCFYYLTVRLGLRTSEVYAVRRDNAMEVPPMLVVDQAVHRGTKTREASLGTRKNGEALHLALDQDVLEAIRWHVDQGYAGPEFLFSLDGSFPRYLDSHRRALRYVQRELGLPELSHHYIGRHSVASQAVTSGHSLKAVQATLGHRSAQSTEAYAHLGPQAQLRLVRALAPSSPPHRGQHLVNEDGQ